MGIMRRFEERIEQRLTAMAARCEQQKRDPLKVAGEVGRLLAKNTRAERLFVAFVLWKTLAALVRQAGLGDEPRRVLRN